MASSTEMATSTGSIDVMTTAMTARFTPPASCSHSWTFEPEGANDIKGGLLLQNAASSDSIDAACWPSGYTHYERLQPTQVFSPGYCPVGYTSADVAIDQPVTTVACCLSGFSYIGSVLGLDTAKTYAGCTSMFASKSSTIVTVRGDLGSSTQVFGPMTMWGQPIIVELQSSDSSLFVSSTTTAGSTSTQDTTTQTTGTGDSTGTSAPSGGSSEGLSTGAKTGIGVGVGVGVVGVVALIAAILLFRRRKRATSAGDVTSGPQQNPMLGPFYQDSGFSSTVYSPPSHNYAGSHSTDAPAELPGNKDNPGVQQISPAELDGRIQ